MSDINQTQSKVNLTEIPEKSSGGEIFGKIIIGIIVGCIISGLLFMILFTITKTKNGDTSSLATSPILPLLLIVSGFLASFIGNLGIAGLYSLFFSKSYHNMSKTMGVLLLTNGLLFAFLLPVYIIFNKNINTLFMILGFHIIIATFLSSQQMENMKSPNYSASSLVGNTFSLALTMLIYGIIRKTAAVGELDNQIYLLLAIPPILGFGIIPLGLGLWESIYYKLFEIGNNPFYAESKGELNKKELDYLQKEEKLNEIDEDINIDL